MSSIADAALRPSGRRPEELRPVRLTRGYTKHAEGSVMVEFGDNQPFSTFVHCVRERTQWGLC